MRTWISSRRSLGPRPRATWPRRATNWRSVQRSNGIDGATAGSHRDLGPLRRNVVQIVEFPPSLRFISFVGVCFPTQAPHVELRNEVRSYAGAFAHYGRLLLDADVFPYPGEPNMCHLNVCEMLRSGEFDGYMMTGFALGHDETWHLHSWWCQQDGTILETAPTPFRPTSEWHFRTKVHTPIATGDLVRRSRRGLMVPDRGRRSRRPSSPYAIPPS